MCLSNGIKKRQPFGCRLVWHVRCALTGGNWLSRQSQSRVISLDGVVMMRLASSTTKLITRGITFLATKGCVPHSANLRVRFDSSHKDNIISFLAARQVVCGHFLPPIVILRGTTLEFWLAPSLHHLDTPQPSLPKRF